MGAIELHWYMFGLGTSVGLLRVWLIRQCYVTLLWLNFLGLYLSLANKYKLVANFLKCHLLSSGFLTQQEPRDTWGKKPFFRGQ